MNYFIKRETQEYGPYSLAELQRYVATGNIALTDLCRSEAMTEWVPVSQAIGTIPAPQQATVVTPTVPAALYPAPPSLHWGLAVFLGFVTCFLFGWVWVFIQAAWIRKVQPASKAIALLATSIGLALMAGLVSAANTPEANAVSGLLHISGLVLWIVAAFNMKSSIEEHYNTVEPIGLQLSGVMTFFFSIYYFQYHFTQINEMKNRQAGGVGYGR